MAAGRAWATGTLCRVSPTDLAEDAALWDIDPALLDVAESFEGIWAENLPALRAFLSVDTQLRVTAKGMGGLLVQGLDYQGVKAGLTLAGIAMTPQLWADVQMIEAGMITALSRSH